MSGPGSGWQFDPATATPARPSPALFHRVCSPPSSASPGCRSGWQLDVLIGSRGLLPAPPYPRRRTRRSGAGYRRSCRRVFWLDASDAALHAGVWVGRRCSRSRRCSGSRRACALGLATLLYLSYATRGADLPLVPVGQPAARMRRAGGLPAAPIARRAGSTCCSACCCSSSTGSRDMAKWQSHLGDWQDGSAMTFYYETAPLPVWPAWYAHHLPVWWHHFESRATLVVELVLPCARVRPARGAAGAVRGAYAASSSSTWPPPTTASSSTWRWRCTCSCSPTPTSTRARLARRLAGRPLAFAHQHRRRPRRLRCIGAAVVIALYVGLSITDAAARLRADAGSRASRCWRAAAGVDEPWRLVNTYHLFAQITRERIEPRVRGRGRRRVAGTRAVAQARRSAAARPTWSRHTSRASTSSSGSTACRFQHGTPAYVAAARTAVPRSRSRAAAVRDAAARPPDGGADRVLALSLQRCHAAPARGGRATPVAESRAVPCSTF